MSGNSTDIELLQKENLAVELYLKHGLNFEEIAAQLGYANKSGAQKAYKRGLARVQFPNKEHYFHEHISRLDALIEVFTQPSVQGNIKAVDVLLRVMEQQADLLGLKAPIQIKQEVNHNGPRTLDEEVTDLARIIEYIEGVAADITTLPPVTDQSEPLEVDATSAQGTTTA